MTSFFAFAPLKLCNGKDPHLLSLNTLRDQASFFCSCTTFDCGPTPKLQLYLYLEQSLLRMYYLHSLLCEQLRYQFCKDQFYATRVDSRTTAQNKLHIVRSHHRDCLHTISLLSHQSLAGKWHLALLLMLNLTRSFQSSFLRLLEYQEKSAI